MLQGRWWKQALHLLGSVQDNTDVRVEATKASLCIAMSSEWLCWQAHIDQYCLVIYGTRSTVTPPQCHMNSSRCVECASQEGNRSFTPRKRGKIGCSTLSLLSRLHYQCVVTGNRACTSCLSLQAKTGSAALVSPLAPWHEKSTLRGLDKYRPWTNCGGIQT